MPEPRAFIPRLKQAPCYVLRAGSETKAQKKTGFLFPHFTYTRHGKKKGSESSVPSNLQTVSVPISLLQKEDKPTLYVFNAVTKEMMPIMENTSILDKKVSDLRRLVTLRCGFPVGVYCLRTPVGLEMYDRNTLKDYQTDIGTARHISYQLPPTTRALLCQALQIFQREQKLRFLFADC